jgi:hypothetical protein
VSAGEFLGNISDVGDPGERHLHFVIYDGTNTVGGLASFDATITDNFGQSPLIAPAAAGTSILDVGDVSIYSLANKVRINPGGSNEEDRTITGFGSLVLDSPLAFGHAAGEPVVIISGSGAVGGMAELPAIAETPLEARSQPGRRPGVSAAIATGVTAVLVVGGAAWYVRKRRGTWPG